MTSSRSFWTLFEPFHALTYFAPEAADAYARVGLRGFWRGYFAGRAAPLGRIDAGPVAASFYGFNPHFVARALPSVWTMADPAEALGARFAGVEDVVRRLCPDLIGSSSVAECARSFRAALGRCRTEGRPLFASNVAVDWPREPLLALWQAATTAREQRGDGHVAALTAMQIGPCEAHLLKLAADGNDIGTIRPYRGWDDSDWAVARERLRQRNWLDEEGHVTRHGHLAYADVERTTDGLAAELLQHLSGAELDQIVRLLTVLADRIVASGDIPYPNPIGVPLPAMTEGRGDGSSASRRPGSVHL